MVHPSDQMGTQWEPGVLPGFLIKDLGEPGKAPGLSGAGVVFSQHATGLS